MDRKRILAFSRAPTSVKRGKTIAATASDDRFDDLSNLRVTGICCAVAECVMDRKRILAFSRAPTSVKRGKTIAATASDDRFDDLSNLRVIDRSISGTELHAKLQHCSSFALKQLPDVVSSVAIRQTNKLDEDWVISACVCSTRQIDLKKSTGEVRFPGPKKENCYCGKTHFATHCFVCFMFKWYLQSTDTVFLCCVCLCVSGLHAGTYHGFA
eukprot:TRINITY_DN5478_c0_g1_i3.p1 TRINITY_DN5478_c0_g1~~TRINITY_DN5478_c0_g1_i3.p1  ORF type:complete len:231 (+),score=40.86 TRINITY_DN5478_c0_g1_i3:56-694(+)